MKAIVCIRHLETELNRNKILQGRQNTPILPPSPEVLQKIHEHRLELERYEPFDEVLVSPLLRTQTDGRALRLPRSKDRTFVARIRLWGFFRRA